MSRLAPKGFRPFRGGSTGERCWTPCSATAIRAKSPSQPKCPVLRQEKPRLKKRTTPFGKSCTSSESSHEQSVPHHVWRGCHRHRRSDLDWFRKNRGQSPGSGRVDRQGSNGQSVGRR